MSSVTWRTCQATLWSTSAVADLPRTPDGVIFDIDGTLLVGSSAHLDVLVAVLSETVGRTVEVRMEGERPLIDGWDASGMVDAQVVSRVLATTASDGADAGADADAVARVIDVYTDRFVEGIDAGRLHCGAPVAGAERVLVALRGQGVLLGLSTGNAADVARAKLAAAGIDEGFLFDDRAGFGGRHADRKAVVRAAVESLGLPQSRRTWLVGDTVSDMVAAASVGLRGIGVLTGAAEADALSSAGASDVLASVAGLVRLAPPHD